MTSGTWRVGAFAGVATCFFAQGGLVWADIGEHPGSTVPLSTVAREGETIFREHDCQGCHQIFGMGGFLGPDLTNAARRVPPARFAELLQSGTGVMPAFHLGEQERAAVLAYLEAIDATGQGTPLAPPGEVGPLFAASLGRWEAQGRSLPADVAAGAAAVASHGCDGCHRGFAAEGVGRAPDLSLAARHLGLDGVRAVLGSGRGAMPPASLDEGQTAAVTALLAWVGEHRDELAPSRTLALADLPWFAYPGASRSAVATRGAE